MTATRLCQGFIVFPLRSGHNSEVSSRRVDSIKKNQFQVLRIEANELKLLFLALLPVSVLIMGHFLFDIVGTSFANYATQLIYLGSIATTAQSSIAAAQLWGSAALIYLVSGIGLIGYNFLFLSKNVKGRALFPFLGIASFLMIIGFSYLMWVDEGRRPLSMIFYLTFESLKESSLLPPDLIASTKIILYVINIFSVVVPVLFCAFMPSLLVTPRGGWTENVLASRIELGRQFCTCSSIFLVVGVFHMFAWMMWSCTMLGRPELSQLVSGVVFFWGIVFSTMLATLYLCIMSTLNVRRESLDDPRESSSDSRPQLFSELGIVFNGLTQAKQALIVFGPVISAFAASASAQ